MDARDLDRRLLSSTFWIALSAGANQVVSFLVFVVIARLVTPAAFGLVTLAAVLIELLQILANGGIADAVIQRAELSPETADTAFWCNLVLGLAVACAACLAAGPAERAFGVAGLAHVILLLATTFLIAPLGAIHSARLARDFGFRALALRNFGATLASGAAGVAVAFAGGGADALIVQRLVAAAATSLIAVASFPWLPRARLVRADVARLGTFGIKIMGAQLLLTANVRGVELIAGFVLGPAGVATIRVANRCIDMMIALTLMPFQQVALPYLSRRQASPTAARDGYRTLSRAAALLTFPVFAIACALAPALVPALFGPSWATAGEVMQVLCFAAIPLHFNILLPATLAASGQPGQVFGWSAAQLLLGLAAAAIGARFGVFGLVLGNLLRAYALLPLGCLVLRRRTGIGLGTVLGAMGMPLAVFAITAAVIGAAAPALRAMLGIWGEIGAGLAAGGLLAGVLTAATMRDSLVAISEMFPGRAGAVLRRVLGRVPVLAAGRAG